MDDKNGMWEYLEGTLFTINIYLMFGRKPMLPFEVEKSELHLTATDDLEELRKELHSHYKRTCSRDVKDKGHTSRLWTKTLRKL